MACKAGICESETVFLWAHMSMPACVSLRSSTRSSPLMLGSCQMCTPCKGRPSHSHQSGTWVHVMLFYYLDAVIEDNLRRAIGYGRRMPGKRPPCSARAALQFGQQFKRAQPHHGMWLDDALCTLHGDESGLCEVSKH